MIKKIDITGIHAEVEPDVAKYAKKKIAKLDGYMPKHARKTVHAEVRLKEEKMKGKKLSTCEVVLYLPGEVIKASETTVNMYAAIDIVEEKLKTQLRKYKDINKTKARHTGKRIKAALRRFSRTEDVV